MQKGQLIQHKKQLFKRCDIYKQIFSQKLKDISRHLFILNVIQTVQNLARRVGS
jgi:hypothetical protein